MYGIKLYIHNDTPPKATPKPLKLLGYIAAALIYLPFAGCGFYCGDVLLSVLFFVCPLIVIAVCLLQAADFAKPYIIITKTTVERHSFILGIHRIKRFAKADISEILKCSGLSLKAKGPSFGFMQYLVFRNRDGKYMFKIADFPNAEKAVKENFPNLKV